MTETGVNYQLYDGGNRLHFDEMMMIMISALLKTNTLSWILIIWVHWNNIKNCRFKRTHDPDSEDTWSWFRGHMILIQRTHDPDSEDTWSWFRGHIILIPSQRVLAITHKCLFNREVIHNNCIIFICLTEK